MYGFRVTQALDGEVVDQALARTKQHFSSIQFREYAIERRASHAHDTAAGKRRINARRDVRTTGESAYRAPFSEEMAILTASSGTARDSLVEQLRPQHEHWNDMRVGYKRVPVCNPT
jgi:hypothetical protein